MKSTDKLRFSDEYPFYVYGHYRKDTGQPFYIGRGKKYKDRLECEGEYQRAQEKGLEDRSEFWHNVVNSAMGYTIEIILDDLTFEEAKAKEIEFIALYGRRNIGKGPLVNLTDGGEGNDGLVVKESVKQYFKELYTIPIEKNIYDNTFPEPNTGCFLWAGSCLHGGRAYINVEGKSYPANKFLYEYYNNIKLEKGQFIHRSCENSLCVNPDHFVLGTYKERRKPHRSTFKQHLQKINEDTVREIRKLKSEGKNEKEITNQLSLTRSIVNSVLIGKTWRWVI